MRFFPARWRSLGKGSLRDHDKQSRDMEPEAMRMPWTEWQSFGMQRFHVTTFAVAMGS